MTYLVALACRPLAGRTCELGKSRQKQLRQYLKFTYWYLKCNYHFRLAYRRFNSTFALLRDIAHLQAASGRAREQRAPHIVMGFSSIDRAVILRWKIAVLLAFAANAQVLHFPEQAPMQSDWLTDLLPHISICNHAKEVSCFKWKIFVFWTHEVKLAGFVPLSRER